MTGFFGKLFGGKKRDVSESGSALGLVKNMTSGLIDRTGLDIDFEATQEMADGVEEIHVEVFGEDESILTERDGALLDAFQLFVKRVLQHQLPDLKVNLTMDCGGFREESNRSLVDLAERLKERALEQGRSVYLRALPPKDRKVIHQYLAGDDRVRSRSVGDGLYKKIKIYPVKTHAGENASEMTETI